MLRHGDLARVDETYDIPEIVVANVLDDNDGVRMHVLGQDILKPWTAGREDGLVRLDRFPIGRQRDVAQRLPGQELVEGFRQFLGVIDPGEAEVLASTAATAARGGGGPAAAVHDAVTVAAVDDATVGATERREAAAATDGILLGKK